MPRCFQFLGIPPKGEPAKTVASHSCVSWFPISRDPPEGGTVHVFQALAEQAVFPISRDPPEGGTRPSEEQQAPLCRQFPISRDPPEGGTAMPAPAQPAAPVTKASFQFLGIPPKGEQAGASV